MTNFRHTARRVVGVDIDMSQSHVGAFPISIGASAIAEVAHSEATELKALQMRDALGGPETLILGVDRLDHTKGILHRLRAYEELLEEGTLDPLTTSFVQVAVPSRENLDAYHGLRDEVERTVGRINGT